MRGSGRSRSARRDPCIHIQLTCAAEPSHCDIESALVSSHIRFVVARHGEHACGGLAARAMRGGALAYIYIYTHTFLGERKGTMVEHLTRPWPKAWRERCLSCRSILVSMRARVPRIARLQTKSFITTQSCMHWTHRFERRAVTHMMQLPCVLCSTSSPGQTRPLCMGAPS